MIVGGIVTLSTAYLKLFVQNQISNQNEHLSSQREKMMNEIRKDFIQKDVMEREIKVLEDRIKLIKERHQRKL